MEDPRDARIASLEAALADYRRGLKTYMAGHVARVRELERKVEHQTQSATRALPAGGRLFASPSAAREGEEDQFGAVRDVFAQELDRFVAQAVVGQVVGAVSEDAEAKERQTVEQLSQRVSELSDKVTSLEADNSDLRSRLHEAYEMLEDQSNDATRAMSSFLQQRNSGDQGPTASSFALDAPSPVASSARSMSEPPTPIAYESVQQERNSLQRQLTSCHRTISTYQSQLELLRHENTKLLGDLQRVTESRDDLQRRLLASTASSSLNLSEASPRTPERSAAKKPSPAKSRPPNLQTAPAPAERRWPSVAPGSSADLPNSPSGLLMSPLRTSSLDGMLGSLLDRVFVVVANPKRSLAQSICRLLGLCDLSSTGLTKAFIGLDTTAQQNPGSFDFVVFMDLLSEFVATAFAIVRRTAQHDAQRGPALPLATNEDPAACLVALADMHDAACLHRELAIQLLGHPAPPSPARLAAATAQHKTVGVELSALETDLYQCLRAVESAKRDEAPAAPSRTTVQDALLGLEMLEADPSRCQSVLPSVRAVVRAHIAAVNTIDHDRQLRSRAEAKADNLDALLARVVAVCRDLGGLDDPSIDLDPAAADRVVLSVLTRTTDTIAALTAQLDDARRAGELLQADVIVARQATAAAKEDLDSALVQITTTRMRLDAAESRDAEQRTRIEVLERDAGVLREAQSLHESMRDALVGELELSHNDLRTCRTMLDATEADLARHRRSAIEATAALQRHVAALDAGLRALVGTLFGEGDVRTFAEVAQLLVGDEDVGALEHRLEDQLSRILAAMRGVQEAVGTIKS